MFSFKPVSKVEVDKLFKKKGLQITDNSMAVIAINSKNNQTYGFCLFDYKDLISTILELEYDQKYQFLAEILVKTSLNYVANRGVYIAECSNISIKKELINLGFVEKENLLMTKIPKIMACSCCKNSNKNNE